MASWELRRATGNSAYELYILYDEVSSSNSGNGSTGVRGRIGFIKVASSGGYATYDSAVRWDFYIDGHKYEGTSSLNFGANDPIGTRRQLGTATRTIAHSSDGTRVLHIGGGGASTGTSIGYPSRAGINVTLTPRTRNPSRPGISFISSTYNSVTVDIGAASDTGLGTASVQYNIDYSTSSSFSSYRTRSNVGVGRETLPGLDPNTRYYIRSAIRGRNGAWLQSSTTLSPMTPDGIPTAPSSRSLGSITSSSMVLSWGAATPTGGATLQGYQVQRATDESFSDATLWDLPATANSQTHSNLDRTTTYYFRVRAVSAAGVGPWTDAVSAETLAEIPSAPTLSSVSAIEPSVARVTWTAPSDNGGTPITGYQIQRATNSSFSAGTAVYSDTESPLDATGVPTGSTIYWRVRAENARGYGPWSNVISEYQGASPSAPAAPSVTPSADGTQATIAWTTPSDNGWPITGYVIRRHHSSGSVLQTYTDTASPLIVSGLTPGITYRWSVAAVNEVGTGSFSAQTAQAQPGAPDAPVFSSLVVVDGSTAQLTFSAPENDGGSPITSYRIERSTSSTFSSPTVHTVDAAGVHTVGDLTAGTRYYWRIRAVSAAGTSAASAVRSALQDEIPGPPRNFTVVPGESGLNATASWIAPAPNGGSSVTTYTLRRYSSSGVFQQEYTTSQTSFFVSGLVAGTRYLWDVRASNVMGAGPATAQVSVLQPTPSISAGEYFDGGTPNTAEVTYAWEGTADLSESTATVAAPAGWVAYPDDARVLWRSRDTSVSGSYSAAVTFLRDGGATEDFNAGLASVIAVPEDADMTASMYIRAPRQQSFALLMQFFDDSDSLLGQTMGAEFTVPAGEWVRASHAFQSPLGAARATLRAYAVNAAGDTPFKAGETFYFDAAMVTLGTSLYPYFDGSTPDTERFLYSWEGAEHNSESRRDSLEVVPKDVDPLQDPDCPPFPAPPRPPSVDPSCVTEVDRWRRYWIQVPGSLIPKAMVAVPILTLRTYQSSVNQIRIRFYEDPDDAGETGVNPEMYVSEQIVSYLPANSTLTLDSMQERAYATVGGGRSVAADHLVYGEGGTPPVWPLMDCGIGYMIALDVPSALPVGAVEMMVKLARRMR